jgi:hypothetical protein
MPTYRRADDQEIWHWCSNCSNWPFYDYEEIYDKPDSEHFCDECKKKEKEGKCRK